MLSVCKYFMYIVSFWHRYLRVQNYIPFHVHLGMDTHSTLQNICIVKPKKTAMISIPMLSYPYFRRFSMITSTFQKNWWCLNPNRSTLLRTVPPLVQADQPTVVDPYPEPSWSTADVAAFYGISTFRVQCLHICIYIYILQFFSVYII